MIKWLKFTQSYFCIGSVTFSHSMLRPENDSSWAYQGVGWCVACDDVKGITKWEFEFKWPRTEACWACKDRRVTAEVWTQLCILGTVLAHWVRVVAVSPVPSALTVASLNCFLSKLVCHISTFSHYLCSWFRLWLLIIFLF